MDDVSGSEDETIVEAGVAPVDGEPSTPTPGSVLGRYVVIRELGRGGMGLVLLAYDPTLHREVALKIVRTRSEGAQARLVREARAMARISHPNVVAVYDATVSEDHAGGRQVVLAMEYVRGTTLGEWLESAERTPEQVVARFIEAGRGLAAAHREDLLHRDFKPANVLVGEDGRVRVTDFGIARVDASSRSSDGVAPDSTPPDVDTGSTLTEAGSVVGTPRYMAPEQHRARALTPAADQYAFCLALYEALAGTPPFSETGDALVRRKLDGPPPWPRDASVPSGVAEAVLRGLHPRPDARFSSLDALLAKLQPARASRGAWIVATALVTGATVWVAASSGSPEPPCQGAQQHLVGVWDDSRREAVRAVVLGTEAVYADDAWRNIDATLTDWTSQWTDGHEAACKATQRGEQSEEMLDLRNACLDRAMTQLSAAVNVLEHATPEVLLRAHRVVGALPRLTDCADLDALRTGIPRPAPEASPVVDEARQQLARAAAQLEAGQYAEAEATIRDTPALLEGVDYPPADIELLLVQAEVQRLLGHYADAERSLREVQRRAAREQDWRAAMKASRKLISLLGRETGRADEALAFRELALGASEGDAESTARVHAAVAATLHHKGDLEGAEEEYRVALELLIEARGPGDTVVATLRNNFGTLLEKRGKYGEACDEYESALAAAETKLGEAHPLVATWRSNLAGVRLLQGRPADAVAEFQRSVDQMSRSMGDNHPSVLSNRVNLAGALSEQGETAQAIEIVRDVLPSMVEQLGRSHRVVFIARDILAVALNRQGDYAEAEREHRRALEDAIEAFGPDDQEVAMTRAQLAVDLLDQDKLDEAETQLRAALDIRSRSADPRHPEVARLHENLGLLLVRTDRAEEAVAEHTAALELWTEAADEPGNANVVRAREALADALEAAGRHVEAAEQRRAAAAITVPEG